MLGENLLKTAHHFANLGILNWVISPGSRNAPIVAALIKQGSFKLYSSPDERSAAFTAMGMAISTKQPAAFLCTSGSALSNAYPAVLESYYSRIPLIVVSADRPEELIDQWDGQTIRQLNFFGDYARSFIHLNARMDNEQIALDRISNCIHKSVSPIAGPVHINIALSEPIYEGIGSITPDLGNDSIETFSTSNEKSPILTDCSFELPPNSKVAIIIGQGYRNNQVAEVLSSLAISIPIFTDVTSGYPEIGLSNWDWALLKRTIPEDLKPDLIFTMGMGIISKPLKLELRKWKPRHIHISEVSEVADPFQTNPVHWLSDEYNILEMLKGTLNTMVDKDYVQEWKSFINSQTLSSNDLPLPYNYELAFVRSVITSSNENHHLHFGNSMSVRYASWSSMGNAKIFSNRGVSGIDGCLSTALGDSLAHPEKTIIAVVGDITTFYDSNAFWGEWPNNFHVVILNNRGGAIFDWIDGPNQFKDLRPFIHTPHEKSFKHLAKLHNKSFKVTNLINEKVTLDTIIENQVTEIQTQ